MYEKLLESKNLKELKKNIVKEYFNLKEGDYLIAQYEERKDVYENLFIKIAIGDQSIEVDDTWLINNLAYFNNVNEGRKFIYNIIVWTNYMGNNLYSFNPTFMNTNELKVLNDHDYSLYRQNYVISDGDEVAILKKHSFKKDALIFYYPSVQSYIKDNYIKTLYLEFELFYELDKSNLEVETDESKLDNSYFHHSKKTMDNTGYIRGTIKLSQSEINENFTKDVEKELNIKVCDLNGEYRRLNKNNYNDDLEVGFIAFDKNVYKEIKNHLNIYPLFLSTKKMNNSIRYYVDVKEDMLIVSEGSYNSLPKDIKKAIYKYMNQDYKLNLINELSDAYKSRYLKGMRDVSKYMTDYEKISKEIYSKYNAKAVDYGYNHIFVEDEEELSGQINKIKDITGRNIEYKIDENKSPMENMILFSKLILSDIYD